MDISIRSAASSDLAGIWMILEPVIRAGGTYVFAQDSSKDKMLTYWLGNDKKTYVAEYEGRLVGTFYIKSNQPDFGDHICNAGFVVNPDFSGKGIGRAMGVFALREARRLGYLGMQFNFVIKSNDRAVRLWESLGFEILGEIPDAYRHPSLGLVPALIMYQALQ